jgi:hypothetical protein
VSCVWVFIVISFASLFRQRGCIEITGYEIKLRNLRPVEGGGGG